MAEHKVQQYKVEAVQKLKGWFKESPDLIFSDFRGLTFPQMTDLRAKLGERKTLYRVVRNAFAKIALKESGLARRLGDARGAHGPRVPGRRPGARGEGARRVHPDGAPEGEGRDHRRPPLQRQGGRGAVAPAQPRWSCSGSSWAP